MADTELDVDDKGFPVLFATRAPGQVAPQTSSGVSIRRGAASGNPNADTGSGRFAGKATGRATKVQGSDVVVTQQTRTLPQGVTQEQWEKRQDIVRDAARQLAEIDPVTAKNFLKTHPNVNHDQVNVDTFVQDVRAARLDDLTDALNQQLKTGLVKVQMGRRMIKSVFRGLTPDEATRVVTRLEGRGWSKEDVKSKVVKLATGATKTKLDQLYGEDKKGKGG